MFELNCFLPFYEVLFIWDSVIQFQAFSFLSLFGKPVYLLINKCKWDNVGSLHGKKGDRFLSVMLKANRFESF